MDRRDFLRSTVNTTTAAGATLLAGAASIGAEAYDNLTGRVQDVAEGLQSAVAGLGSRLDAVERFQRLLLVLILLALLLDGGMSWWIMSALAGNPLAA